MSTEPMASEATQQNEQQVDGGFGGQTAGFNEQAGGPGAPQQNEQQVGGHGGQTAGFNEQAGGFGGESRGEAPRAPVFHGATPQPEPSTHGDMSDGMHGGEPVSFAAGGGGETDYGTGVNEEPTHVSSEEHSFEDAGHAAATEDTGGDAGHDGGADAGQEVHHG
jgi:hypothetical protein